MFGYVLPLKPELKVREWYTYRAYYCGLCKELKREYGFVSRLFLNYDLVLLALLADSLADVQSTACAERCIANPLTKQPVCATSGGLALAADCLVLTAYYKLADDMIDEKLLHRLPSLMLRPFLSKMRKKAAARRPEVDAILAQQTAAQTALEQSKSQNADAAADATAQMTAALFCCAAANEAQKHILARLGLFVGKMIYYLDAAEDYEKDAAHGAYNVFLLQEKSKEEAVQQAQILCRMCAGEASLCYNLLELQQNRPLLDNIFFLGLPHSIALAGQKRTKSDHNGTKEDY
ncbi:MAG: DUF5685 family protein [Ruthenibacterium sp.]